MNQDTTYYRYQSTHYHVGAKLAGPGKDVKTEGSARVKGVQLNPNVAAFVPRRDKQTGANVAGSSVKVSKLNPDVAAFVSRRER